MIHALLKRLMLTAIVIVVSPIALVWAFVSVWTPND